MKWIALCGLVGVLPLAAAAEPPGADAGGMTAAEIVAKNVDARGGAEAWRKIDTMIWVGHIESPDSHVKNLPFVLEMKRPDKTRFELKADNQLAVRMFDGSQGWKLRSVPNGRPRLLPFNRAEMDAARDGQVIDGPLIGYKEKGNEVTLEGVDQVQGHNAYRLKVTLPSGASRHVWLDTQSFLEVESDRRAHDPMGGLTGNILIYYSDYHAVNGVQLPFTIETVSAMRKATNRMMIDKVVLNPPLDDKIFARPQVPGGRLPHNEQRSGPQSIAGMQSRTAAMAQAESHEEH